MFHLNNMPIWVRLTVSIWVLLISSWSGVILWESHSNRHAAIDQAQDFSLSMHDSAMAGLTSLMIADAMEKRHVFLDQIKQFPAIRDLRVVPSDVAREGVESSKSTDKNSNNLKPDALEAEVIKTGHELIELREDASGPYLLTIRPTKNVKSYLGKNCLSCHDAPENATLGVISMKISLSKIDSEVTKQCIRSLLVALMVSVLMMVLIWYFIRGAVTRPIEEMVFGLRAIVSGDGDLSARLKVKGNDEIAQASAAFNAMMTSLQAALTSINVVMAGVARGDFTLRVNADMRGDLLQLKQNINGSVSQLACNMDELTLVMKALRAGDFSKRVDAKVEGQFKQAVDQAMQAMQSMLSDVGGVMKAVSHGNLTGRVTAEGAGDLAQLKVAINLSLNELSAALKVINENTRQVATAANQSSTAIGQISDGAQNQMHAISQVATAVRETAASVSDVSSNTEAASNKSQQSVTIVRDGKIKMKRMVEVVSSIAANSAKINKITEVIEGIANKTNLLSLNAAIEAARAGEHGRGFAVVAEEVGKLAANSASSAQEITLLVQQAVLDADRAVETVKEVAADMERIEAGSVEANGMLERIAAAMEQQSAAVHQINASVMNLNQIGQSNAAASEEITATVVELAKIADNTRREVDKFTV